MKNICNYIFERSSKKVINEKLKLNSQSKLANRYHYHPKSFAALRSLLIKLLDERGKDADLNDIDVSKINSFYDAHKKFTGLFEGLDPHNIDISKWEVGHVISMHKMFNGCKNFNCDLSNWNVRECKELTEMFNDCEKFDCNLSKWNTQSCTTMSYMFGNCISFNGIGLERWDVSNVEDMYGMFENCTKFNCNLSKWNVKNVTDMTSMFSGCAKFTGEGLKNWKPINCESLQWMFDDCPSLKNRPSWYTDNI